MEETKVAIKAAKEAGKLLMERFGLVHDVEEKAQGEIVTEADKASEGIILVILRKEFPQYAILSEESGSSGNGGMMWVVDPLDG
ncbi:MAG: inositol monophosphatase, partial [Candidatus Aenigmarchaeota archaeon]|nr:inositol monophosphatase [Candidatus Aenigmarchaeota archaeon]